MLQPEPRSAPPDRRRLVGAALAAAGALLLLGALADDYDPLERARAAGRRVVNQEATVPPQCYTRTDGVSNPCWTCHTVPRDPNFLVDWELQKEYAFSDFALTNRWENLHVDRSAAIAAIADREALDWIRSDNYQALRRALAERRDYPGYRPDLDLAAGFDERGFARDGSGWRALRYKPFPGTFWPANGSTDDVMIRLPRPFRSRGGVPSTEVYAANLAILEAAIAADPFKPAAALDREVGPIDETAAGLDLDRDGRIGGTVQRLRGLPPHYAGDARAVEVHRYLYPEGTEFLHTVRYVDPDHPALLSVRLKELRYSRKVRFLDLWALQRSQERESDEKDEGRLPMFAGEPLVGLQSDIGWQLQGFIEDGRGRLRLQTEEEHRFCMGCHGATGVAVDGTFTLARKVPGTAGWRHQDLRGMPDVPQAGHPEPEVLTYFKRVQGGDEFRANGEILARFFPGGVLDEAAVRRAAKGGDRDLLDLLAPSRDRALTLAKAYMTVVREQSFDKGRDAFPRPITNVHRTIENGSTDLARTGRVFHDGRLWLDW
jgi:hypothetical protein